MQQAEGVAEQGPEKGSCYQRRGTKRRLEKIP